jgi:predicted YcjX-like family ATPase
MKMIEVDKLKQEILGWCHDEDRSHIPEEVMDEIIDSLTEELESENAALKAQHETDEKALRRLADVFSTYLDEDCSECPARDREECDNVTCHDDCVKALIVYAREKAKE